MSRAKELKNKLSNEANQKGELTIPLLKTGVAKLPDLFKNGQDKRVVNLLSDVANGINNGLQDLDSISDPEIKKLADMAGKLSDGLFKAAKKLKDK